MTMAVGSPKVSICIPVFNGELYLLQAVTSALQQTYANYEIVIIDNKSTDGTALLAERIASTNNKVRFIRNTHNIGLVGNFNACLQHAQGDYIKFLCADDLLLPTCLERMANSLDAHPSAVLIAAARLVIDENGDGVGIKRYSRKESLVSGEVAIRRCLFGANYIGEPTAVMFRRLQASRGFCEELSFLTDLEMWFYLLERGDLLALPETLCAFRRHKGQMTVASIKSGALVEDNIVLYERYKDKPYIKKSLMNVLSHRLRMAYRIWICRDNINPLRRNELLKKYSFPMAYYLVCPLFFRVVTWFRQARK